MTDRTKRHAAWWWIDRWRKSTAYTDMTLAEQGAYRNLLDELWLRGGVLPNDERVLSRACGDQLEWPKVRTKILARFRQTPDGWRHDTHDEVSAWPELQAEKGRKRAAQAAREGGRFTSRPPAEQPAGAPAGAPADDQPVGGGERTPDSRAGALGCVAGTQLHASITPNPPAEPAEQPAGAPAEHQPPYPYPYPLRNTEHACLQVGRKSVVGPALPPADRAERAIRLSTEALRTKLYGLITEMAEADPEHQDPTELMRMVTAYDKPDGSRVKGVVNAALLTHERLEHSIADAEAQLAEWRAASGATPARNA